jgi:hypothetical protein
MKKQTGFFILIAVLIGIALGILAWDIFTPNLAKGVFYYQVENSKVKLFLITGKDEPEEIGSFPAREVDFGKYKPPRHSYISNNGKQMIYFKKTGEVPLEEFDLGENIVAVRVISEPILVNLKTSNEKKIDQPIDSSGLVFSPNDEQIVWIKQVKEATFQDIEEGGKRRELWISRVDGEDGKFLANFDENVILLKQWVGDYIYFQGIWDVSVRSLGRINIKTKKVDYLNPQLCGEFLENCKEIKFSNSGKYFFYEIYEKTNDKEITQLYLGDFEKREYQALLTTDRISDSLWLYNEKEFLYTEQEMVRKEGGGGQKEMRETIHLVNFKRQTDDIIYAGSYVSQLTIDPNNRYLYFLEKQRQGDNFDLRRLDIKTKKTETILTGDYNHILLVK